jgi:Xaa-Pro dipeptidase
VTAVAERDRRTSYRRVRDAMSSRGIDAMLLCRYADAHRVSGARRVQVAGGPGGVPWVAAFASEEAPRVYTTDLDGVPEWIGAGQAMRWDASHLVEQIAARRPKRIAYDVLAPRLVQTIETALPGVEWADARTVLEAAEPPSASDSGFPPRRETTADLADGSRLARDRRAKLDRAIVRSSVDAMVLFKPANVRYATGTRAECAIVVPGRDAVLPKTSLEPPRLASLVAESSSGARRLALDRWTPASRTALQSALPRAEWLDADALLAEERIVKLPAEIALLRRAQELNERAIEPVLAALRPGIREIDLTAVFHEAVEAGGEAEVHVESVWCVSPKTAAEAPWTPRGALPYRELTSDRVLRDGDLVVMDTGILHEGYMSDFGRTWRCGTGRPTDGERRLFEEWCEIRDRLFAACRPGNTALSLRRASLAGWRRPEPPWPLPLYVAHSLGLGGVEPPFVGTDLGEAVEDRWLLQPGTVIVFEPYVWEEGIGGHRAEETVVVTETGCERFTRFPYGALES